MRGPRKKKPTQRKESFFRLRIFSSHVELLSMLRGRAECRQANFVNEQHQHDLNVNNQTIFQMESVTKFIGHI